MTFNYILCNSTFLTKKNLVQISLKFLLDMISGMHSGAKKILNSQLISGSPAGPKWFWTCPKWFLTGPKLFWTDPNVFGLDQKISNLSFCFFWTFCISIKFLVQFKIIWTSLKVFLDLFKTILDQSKTILVQSNTIWVQSKIIWTCLKVFLDLSKSIFGPV